MLGEAPGRVETERGEPFVGPSGALLDQAFQLLGINREELYITNACKIHPTDEVGATRRPTSEEIQQWLPTLKYELKRVCPGAVLLLGQVAATSWGWTPDLVEQGIYSAWHPAFVLRKMRDDPQVVNAWFDQLEPFVRRVRELEAQL